MYVNTSKSEVVHFNSAGETVPVFNVGGAINHHKEYSRYLGMAFYRTLDMEKVKTTQAVKATPHIT